MNKPIDVRPTIQPSKEERQRSMERMGGGKDGNAAPDQLSLAEAERIGEHPVSEARITGETPDVLPDEPEHGQVAWPFNTADDANRPDVLPK